ncbi:hypothetical protein BDV29DRAFT_159187 [Aspergillus leporis]|jgi:hypothetical protein|uniref:Uncharacterized protein n=1 Tax=Aspergillus leporis TaxID=41062 RepID=A0A5N5WX75_9EURO|nr:hypothetical protein BDV29DRAFT_159187 [Aspergillus leporis]
MRDKKPLKTGLTRKPQGCLVAIASQPKPHQLHPSNSGSTSDVSTIAVHPQFNPAGDQQPPKLESLCSKLRVSTFYTITPWADFPTSPYADSLGRYHYMTTVPISSLSVGSPRRIRHSGVEESSGSASATGGRDTYYTTTVVVPYHTVREKNICAYFSLVLGLTGLCFGFEHFLLRTPCQSVDSITLSATTDPDHVSTGIATAG